MRTPRFQLMATTVLLALVMALGAFVFRLWIVNREFSKKPSPPAIIYRQALIQNSFLNSDGLASYSNQSFFSDEKKDLIEEKKSFVEINLQKMILTLYEGGEAKEELPVLSKGREGSWWETPTGRYKALTKEVNHFSSIGKVWMPWSIQFYGNFFIHGWPYYQNGEPVPKSYSGGCVRLSSEDAERVFSFVTEGMPIILLDSDSGPAFYSEIQPSSSEIGVPVILAKAVLVSDLDTGGIILDKNAGDVLPIASLTKLMTATVASELIYLGRSVIIDEAMLKDAIQSYPLKAGERIQAFDLLYPLLMESSNGSARALAAFMGERYFLSQMKAKAMTLSMKDTDFEDPAGIGDGNLSSLKDLAKLSKYIFEKRKFIFEVGKGEDFHFFGVNTLSGIKNYNEFADEKNLIGMKNGGTETAGQTILTVWRMKDRRGDPRNIFIGVLGSENRVRDAEAARAWLKAVFGLE